MRELTDEERHWPRIVERWRPGDTSREVLRDQLEWRPAASNEPMIVDLIAFFAATS